MNSASHPIRFKVYTGHRTCSTQPAESSTLAPTSQYLALTITDDLTDLLRVTALVQVNPALEACDVDPLELPEHKLPAVACGNKVS